MGKGTEKPLYRSRTAPFGPFQTEATQRGLGLEFYGLFMEQGTGKSKVAIDIAGQRWCDGEITGVLIIAFNGVHHQWIEEAFPDHLGEMVPYRAWAYSPGKKVPPALFKKDKLAVLSINFESVFRKEGQKIVEAFVTMHGGNIQGIIDEGQRIKNPDAKSSQMIFDLGKRIKYRMDLTGTPMAKDLTDIWSQFKWLDPRGEANLGHKYKATFRAEYCRMHPKIAGVVIGAKKEEQFYERIAPYIYRVTKAEALDLPPKVYDRFTFELHPTQRRIYNELRDTFISEIDKGKVTTVKNALTLVMRLQQVTCGYVALDKEDPDAATQFEMLPNSRMDALKQVRKSRLGKVVVWSRFRKDIELQKQAYNSGVSYYGADGKTEKNENKRLFINDPNITEFFANPASAGTGVDGLQKVARTAIYYSNSFNVIHRWQSEDRIDRIGLGIGASTYIDLVARGTVDVGILANHKQKKQLSDLVLDDIRQLLMIGED